MVPESMQLSPEETRFKARMILERSAKHEARREHGNGGSVYFVACGAYVKIGFAEAVPKRLTELQLANPEPLVLIGQVPGGLDRETELHRLFAKWRHRGEWFHLNDETRNLIEGLLTARL
jgi:hypothetical protein